MYTYDHNTTTVLIALYDDGILVFESIVFVVDKIKIKLMDKFQKNKFPGDVSLCLSVQITRDRKREALPFTQKDYTISIFAQSDAECCKTLSTPGLRSYRSPEQAVDIISNSKEAQRYQLVDYVYSEYLTVG